MAYGAAALPPGKIPKNAIGCLRKGAGAGLLTHRHRMRNLAKRVRGYVQWARRLRRYGATWGSVLLSPIRRRLFDPRNQIDLKNGISILAPADEPLGGLFEEVWADRCYMPADFQLDPGDTVVDIGANVGVFTLWAKACWPEVKIVAIEPSPRMCDFFRRNLAKNRVTDVVLLQAACGGYCGEAVLYSRGAEAANSLFQRDAVGSSFRPLGRTQILTLDEVFRRFNIEICHLLKLDCEGAEYDILLKASEETLQRVRRITMEYHVGLNEHVPAELAALLEAQGFEVDCGPLLDAEHGYLYASRNS